MTLKQAQFADWLRRYGDAWEARDLKSVVTLFAEDAEYFWTPFDPPKRGRDQIVAAWMEATSEQRDITFTFTILSVKEAVGIAKWHTRLRRAASGRLAELDGILVAEFDRTALCKTFREWWHAHEP